MENDKELVFFDSIEAKETFLQGKTSTPTSGRRLSASSRAANLKTKNLIPPLHTLTYRRISLPRATKTPPPLYNMPTSTDKRRPAPKQAEATEEQGKGELSASEKFIAEQLATLTAMIGGV